MGSNDRRDKSWRDIDRKRDKSAHRDDKPNSAQSKERQRQESAAYNKYKGDLDKMFDTGEVPDYLKGQFSQGDQKVEGRLQLLASIKKATDKHELTDAVKNYLTKFDDFPEDPDLLLQLLDYQDENVVLKVALQVHQYASTRPLPHKQQFKLKVDSLAMLTSNNELGSVLDELLDILD